MEEELEAVRIIINENDIHMDEMEEDGPGDGGPDSSESQEDDKVTGKPQKCVRGEEMNDGGKGDS